MMDDSQKSSALDQVKRELRSILISSKNGVPLRQIKSDYEMLSCNRLPFRDFGFSDVESFMRSMPDVATERRLPDGELAYVAVGDDTTAHIQKLISSQKAPTKKKRGAKFSLRGRGGFRGGRSWRGGLRGGFTSQPVQSFRGRGASTPKPRRPILGRGGYQGSFGSSSFMTASSGDVRNITNPGWVGGTSKNVSHVSREVSDCEDWDKENKGFSREAHNLQIGLNKDGARTITKQPDLREFLNTRKDCQTPRDTHPSENAFNGVSGDVRVANGGFSNNANTRDTNSNSNDWDDGNNSNARGTNNSNWDEDSKSTVMDARSKSNNWDHATNFNVRGTSNSNNRDTESSTVGDNRINSNKWQDGSNSNTRDVTRKGWKDALHRIVTVTQEENEKNATRQKAGINRATRNTYVAPRFQRRHQENQDRNTCREDINSNYKSDQQSGKRLNESFQETAVCCTIDSKNWHPPERGKDYLAAFNKFFTDNNLPVPDLEVVRGKYMKKKGFYGRLMYEGKMIFPLEILETEEEARQNAARSFCLKFGVPLLGETVVTEEKKVDTVPLKLPEVKESPDMKKSPEAMSRSSQASSSPLTSRSTSSGVESAPPSPIPRETKIRIYKIINPQGLFIRMLPKLYQDTYGETLGQESIDRLGQCTDFFNLEEPVPGRYIVYQVPDALNKMLDEASHKACKHSNPEVPPVGTVFDATFSFAYSADEIYVQRAETADLLYNIEDILAPHCEESVLPTQDELAEGSIIAACYNDEWYRARILKQDGPMVTVSFIDYGNREEVNVSNTRSLPTNEVVDNTPPLAIPCMARKKQQGEWCSNISEILTSISETFPSLSVEVKHLAGSHCVVDLSLPDGRSINAMMTRRQSLTSEDPQLPLPAMVPQSPLPTMVQQSPLPTMVQQSLLPPSLVLPSPGTSSSPFQYMSPITQAASQLLSQQVASPTSNRMVPSKIFTEDPEPLALPMSDSFGAFVCGVMSESSVLLRIVEDEYSDKLDDLEMAMSERFDQWPQPVKIQPSNVYACKLLSEDDEEGSDREDKFHRVRVLKINEKKGTCDCYLLDHGGQETVKKESIRCIDTELNKSLSYQAIYASLYGLDSLHKNHKVAATKILIHLTVHAGVTFMAVRKDRKQLSGTGGHDPLIIERVRKIISCLPEVNPTKVTKVYEDLFKHKLENVEEIIKLIPGYGIWKQSLEVELIDSSEEEGDYSLNNTILTLLQEIAHLTESGRGEEEALKDVLGSDVSSQADTTDTSSLGDFSDRGTASKSNNKVQSVLTNLEGGSSSLNTSLNSHCDISLNASAAENQPKFFRNCPAIPPYIEFEVKVDLFVPLYVMRSESPSYFVGTPFDQKDELEKLQQTLNDCLSNNPKTAIVLSKSCLYAVKRDGVWRRTIYIGQIKHLLEVFYPDYHLFDTVTADQMYILPPQFYSTPLLARKMSLAGIRPTSQNWSEAAKFWFMQETNDKDMYIIVIGTDNSPGAAQGCLSMDGADAARRSVHLPPLLYVQLVDTSEEFDVILDHVLCDKGWARMM